MKLFDGYNLIGAAADLGITLSQTDKEERLLRFLGACRARRRGGSWLVVFDGDYGRLTRGPKKYSRGGIGVEWAVGESADSCIERKVRRSRNPRGLEVITSDEELLRSVRAAGGRGIRCPEFISTARALMASGGAVEKPETSTPEEISEWLTLFGDGTDVP